MRNFCIVLFLSLYIIANSLAQKGIDTKYFVLFKTKDSISVNTWKHGKIMEVANLYGWYSDIISNFNNRIILVEEFDSNFKVYNVKSKKTISDTIPFNFISKCCILINNNLFIGGQIYEGSELLLQYNLKTKTWKKLGIPEEMKKDGKSIDDLLVSNGLLIAVDNEIFPKYILTYDLNNIQKGLVNLLDIPAQGADEMIHSARITDNYIAIHSSTSGMFGAFDHLTIYNKSEFLNKELRDNRLKGGDYSANGNYSFKPDCCDFRKSMIFDYNQCFDYILFEDKIMVVHKTNGFGVFDINNLPNNESEIVYKAIDGEIKKLTLIPKTNKAVLTIDTGSKNYLQKIVDIK